MAIPSSAEARLYYRSARRRYEDARILQTAAHTTGAVYLAGYAIECMLKALILDASSARKRAEVMASFRGTRAHQFDWLRSSYLKQGGARLPPEISEAFSLVNTWSTDLRYTPREIGAKDAVIFMGSAQRIMSWADGRL